MRLVTLFALFAALALAEGITIVLDFEGRHSEQAVAEMKREFTGILKDAPVTVDWRTRQQAQREALANLVVVRCKGTCIFDPVGYLYDERGPMAFTYAAPGEVQPFSDVACDRVNTVLRSALSSSDYSKGNVLLGRALGRVLAHEFVHMLSASAIHGREGVARESLSGNQLIAPELRLATEDLERLNTVARSRKATH